MALLLNDASSANVTLDPAAAQELGILPGAYAQAVFTLTGDGMKVPDTGRDIIQRVRGAITITSAAGSVVVLVLIRPQPQ